VEGSTAAWAHLRHPLPHEVKHFDTMIIGVGHEEALAVRANAHAAGLVQLSAPRDTLGRRRGVRGDQAHETQRKYQRITSQSAHLA